MRREPARLTAAEFRKPIVARRLRRTIWSALAVGALLAGLLPVGAMAGATSAPQPAGDAAADVLLTSASTTPGSDAGRGPVGKARLAVGGAHACLLGVDGTIRCWGAGTEGQLGDGQYVASGVGGTRVLGIVDAVAVTAGAAHTCAILAGGSVRCWGNNLKGQIGENGGSKSAQPVVVPDVSGAIAIDAGTQHTCAVLAAGTVKCWGSQEFAQLGNGTTPGGFQATALLVVGLSGATGITAGERHSCARLANGTARCWGDDADGQLGGTVPNGGTIASTPIAVSGLAAVVDLAAGATHTCAVQASGAARCWGSNDSGELGNGAALPAPNAPTPVAVAALPAAVAIAAHGANTCAQLGDGKVRCWGANASGQLGNNTQGSASSNGVEVSAVSGTISIGVGLAFACAARADGNVVCWGANDVKQLNGGFNAVSKVPILVRGRLSTAAIGTGGAHSCALNALGGVQCWGSNVAGELGINDPSVTSSPTQRTVVGLSGVLDISVGSAHVCALLRTGAIKCWGSNANGQLGNTGAGAFAKTPVDVTNLGGTAIAVSAGGQHTCAVLSTFVAKCWGGNGNGQLGDGTNTPRPQPVSVSGLSSALRISAGSTHTCAVLTDSTAKCWGSNSAGELGNADNDEAWTPQTVLFYLEGVSSLTTQRNVVQVIARYAFSCALLADNLVKCWGYNGYGSLGTGSGGNRNHIPGSGTVGAATGSAFSIGPAGMHGAHACAALNDGTARCWGGNGSGELGYGVSGGSNPTPQPVQGLTDVAQITVGYAHSCALLIGGTAKCWGHGGNGQLGDGSYTTPQPFPVTVSGFNAGVRSTAMDAGGSHTCALMANGTVRCWGSNGSGRLGDGTTTQRTKPVVTSGVSNAIGISAGGSHTCAPLAGGLVRCWGANAYGQLGDTTLTSRSTSTPVANLFTATAVSAGGSHTCALLSNGTVKCWGRNTSGQLGDGTTTNRKSPVTVKVSGTTTLSNVVAISSGTDHTCAVLADGTARCWGAGGSGRLGNGSTSNRLYATAVAGVTTSTSVAARFTAISAGGAHTCARIASGAARCWGANGSGRLGDGTTTNRTKPVAVSGLSGVASISAGGSHTCAQLAAGGARCWGYGAKGRLGTGSTSSRTTPGTVSGLSGATGISAGGSHTCAVLGTGALRCWGLNSNGQLGIGSTTSSSTPKAVSGL